LLLLLLLLLLLRPTAATTTVVAAAAATASPTSVGARCDPPRQQNCGGHGLKRATNSARALSRFSIGSVGTDGCTFFFALVVTVTAVSIV
jgi:hypothetical protein